MSFLYFTFSFLDILLSSRVVLISLIGMHRDFFYIGVDFCHLSEQFGSVFLQWPFEVDVRPEFRCMSLLFSACTNASAKVQRILMYS